MSAAKENHVDITAVLNALYDEDLRVRLFEGYAERMWALRLRVAHQRPVGVTALAVDPLSLARPEREPAVEVMWVSDDGTRRMGLLS